MTTVYLSPIGGAGAQFFNNDGVPLSGGLMYTYQAGTSTPQATYTTSAGNVTHSNPIVLDAAGRVPTGEIWLLENASYKFVLKTSADVLIGTWDNITGIIGGELNACQIVYDPPFTNAVQTTVCQKLDQVISVKDFGATGDGVTDDSVAVQNAIDYMFATQKNCLYFPDGVFYFANTVEINFDTARSFRMTGTSSAGFTGVRPGGTKITGKSGLDALFLLTNSNPSAGGAFGFEADHIDFNGNGGGVGSAIKSILGGAPARPFNIHNNQFNQFQKALVSDITAGLNDTGVCQCNITQNNFQGNTYAMWGAGQQCWMDVAFVGNVCEQNANGIYCGTGYFSGGLYIADNLLEGQPNAIDVRLGLCAVEIARNYFEANTGHLIKLESDATSSVFLHNNFYLNSVGADIALSNVQCITTENYNSNGIYFYLNYADSNSQINNNGVVNVLGTSYSIPLDPNSVALNTNPPSGLNSAGWAVVSKNPTPTPNGTMNYESINGLGPLYTYPITASTGDYIVFCTLARPTSAKNTTLSIYAYDQSVVPIGNTELSAGMGGIGVNEWVYNIRILKTSGGTTGFMYWRWASGSALDYTDTYIYRIPNSASPVEANIFLPSPDGGTYTLYGHNYPQTSTASGVSIVDTGIYYNTAGVGFGRSAIYDVFICGDQNAGGNISRNSLLGSLVIGTGAGVGTFDQFINYQDIYNPQQGGTTPKFTVTAWFWNGASETVSQNGTSAQIRLKISGYQAGYEGIGQTVRLVKRL